MVGGLQFPRQERERRERRTNLQSWPVFAPGRERIFDGEELGHKERENGKRPFIRHL